MIYHYFCESGCKVGDYAKSKVDNHTLIVSRKSNKPRAELLVWEVDHPMADKPTVTCPVCNGAASKNLGFLNVGFHIRGNWALDKAGCKREMDLYKLDNPKDNVYDEYYESGERDHIKNNLLKAGRKAMDATRKRDNPVPALSNVRKMVKKKATIIRLS